MTALLTLAKATLGVIAIGAVWLAIDWAWRRTFPGRQIDHCGGCSTCTRRCDRRGDDNEEKSDATLRARHP